MRHVAVPICVLVLCLGCGKKPDPPVLWMFCCETFRDVMEEEADLFAITYGIRMFLLPIFVPETKEPTTAPQPVEEKQRSPAPWRARPANRRTLAAGPAVLNPRITGLIRDIADRKRYGDLYLTDSIRQNEFLHESAAVATEYPFCFLSLTLLVAKGNPLHIDSVKNLLDNARRLGIIDPAVDGMGETAYRLITKNSNAIAKGQTNDRITLFDQHAKLLEALKNGDVDAVLLWKPLVRETHEFAEIVELPEMERQTLQQPILALSFANNDGYGKRFADFLISLKGREILKKHGFVPISQ